MSFPTPRCMRGANRTCDPMPALPAVEYRICPAQPGAHLFEVSCTVRDPDPQGQVFRLPAWIPGSYMIREFARHIVTVRAELDGEPWTIHKLDKHSWRAAPRSPRASARAVATFQSR